MWQRGNSPQRPQRRPCPLSVQCVWLPSAVCVGCCGQSRAVCAGRGLVGRAQFPAQHCPRHGRGADDDCQTAKKKRRPFRCPCLGYVRRRRNAKNGKSWNWMSCEASWATKGVRSGCGPSSNAPDDASWVGRWAAGAKPRCANSGAPCPEATSGTAGISPMSGKPMPPSCPVTSTGRAPKAKDKPISSKLAIAPCASAVACSCENPVRSVNRWKCIRHALK